jgi:hypothetical protein
MHQALHEIGVSEVERMSSSRVARMNQTGYRKCLGRIKKPGFSSELGISDSNLDLER